MYLTAEQYAVVMGEAAPADFGVCLDLAESMIDLYTMNLYSQVAVTSLPLMVQKVLQRATAYQVSAIIQRGGVAGVMEPQTQSASVGKVSYTLRDDAALCRPAAACVPFLMAYMRGCET